MIVHPAALRPIPLAVSTFGTLLGVVFLVLVLGVIHPGNYSKVTFDVSFFGLSTADIGQVDPVQIGQVEVASVRSNTMSVRLLLSPSPAVVNERGAVFFQRADGAIFPVVAEGWVERFDRSGASIFVPPADGALLVQLSGRGRFFWKPIATEGSSPFAALVERRSSVLLHDSPSSVVAASAQVEETPAVEVVATTSDVAPSVLARASLIWFPGTKVSYALSSDGTIHVVQADGTQTKFRVSVHEENVFK